MRYIMHKNSMDVCFEVRKIQYQDSKRGILKGCWYNLGYSGHPFRLTNNQRITIKAGDWKNFWVTIKPDIKRNSPGIPK